MTEKILYIIAGCNGAGKTTAAYTILPEIINCKEFVNADEIAKGLSPFQPEKVSFESGRIMINRINELINHGVTFAFETTLSTKSYQQKIKQAKTEGYIVNILFFWLESMELAKERVRIRVREGGHHIDADIIERRFRRGLRNLFDIYLPIVDGALIFDNTNSKPILIASKKLGQNLNIINQEKYNQIAKIYECTRKTK